MKIKNQGKRATAMLFSFFDWFNILPPFTYEKVEKWNKIGTILMRDVLRTLILKKNFSQQYIFHLMSIVTMDNRNVYSE